MESSNTGRGKGRHKDTYPKVLKAAPEPKKQTKPACPDVLTGEAKIEWDRMLKLLEKLGTLNKADGTALALYCTQYARWCEAERQLTANGYTQTVKEFERQSPWVQISNDACKMVKELLKEFGLTPASRAKFMPEVEDKPAENKALAFLKPPAKHA